MEKDFQFSAFVYKYYLQAIMVAIVIMYIVALLYTSLFEHFSAT